MLRLHDLLFAAHFDLNCGINNMANPDREMLFLSLVIYIAFLDLVMDEEYLTAATLMSLL